MQFRVCASLLFLLASVWSGAQIKPAEYNVNVHVSASRMAVHGNSGAHYQYLTVTIDGKRYEMESIGAVQQLLKLGDYRARLAKDEHGKGDYDSWQVYEFQFPDHRTRRYLVVGQLE